MTNPTPIAAEHSFTEFTPMKRPGWVKDRKVIRCVTCGFWHQHPYPVSQELKEFYADYYNPTASPNRREVLDTSTSLWKGKAPGKVLDIGCGDGELLNLFVKKGWKSTGIEISQAKITSLDPAIRFFNSMLYDVDRAQLGRFDIINTSFVLEHVPNPLEFCAYIHDHLLEPGGIFVCEVPNDFTLIQKAVLAKTKKDEYWVAFDPLEALLMKAGLKPLLRDASYPMEFFALMGEDYIGNEPVGKSCHAKRLSFEQALESHGLHDLKRKLYFKLAELGIGRSVIVYSKKGK